MHAYAYILIVCKFHSVLCIYDDNMRKSPAGLGGGCVKREPQRPAHRHIPGAVRGDDPGASTRGHALLGLMLREAGQAAHNHNKQTNRQSGRAMGMPRGDQPRRVQMRLVKHIPAKDALRLRPGTAPLVGHAGRRLGC